MNDFMKGWIGLFSNSPKPRLAWSTLTELSAPSCSMVRRWSRFEVIKQGHDAFGDVSSFLSGSSLPSASSGKLNAILNDPAKYRKLKIEIAITVDAMSPFVPSTYLLEGDGPLALVAYRQTSKLHATICEHYPNVLQLLRTRLGENTTHEQQLLAYGRNCVQPGYSYFQSKFDANIGELKDTVKAFKAALYCDPAQLNELRPTPADIDFLNAFGFMILLEDLKMSCPLIWQQSKMFHQRLMQLTGGRVMKVKFQVGQLIILVQPSSAAAERVFSTLQNSFSQEQNSSLEDYFSTSIMLQYNRN